MKTPQQIAAETVGNLGEKTMSEALAKAVRTTVRDLIVTAIEADRAQRKLCGR